MRKLYFCLALLFIFSIAFSSADFPNLLNGNPSLPSLDVAQRSNNTYNVNYTAGGTSGITWAEATNSTLANTLTANNFGNFNQTMNVSAFFLWSLLGRIGVNTTTPQNTLNVIGSFNISNGTNSIPSLIVDTVGRVGIGQASPAVPLHITAGAPIIRFDSAGKDYQADVNSQVANTFIIRDVTDGLNILTVNWSGNVGIGTTSPQSKLEVAGLVNSSTGYVVNTSTGFTGTCTIIGLTSITVKGGIITGCT